MIPGDPPRHKDGWVRTLDGRLVARVFEPPRTLPYCPTPEELAEISRTARLSVLAEFDTAHANRQRQERRQQPVK